MKYVSIDIETTGLDAEKCQILEFGAILEDTDKCLPFNKVPKLNLILKHYEIHGDPIAIVMNVKLIHQIAGGIAGHVGIEKLDAVGVIEPQLVTGVFERWVNYHWQWKPTEKLNVAEKNYAGFDSLFLNKLPHWNRINFRHRVLDPGPMFVRSTDEKIPDLQECLKRAGQGDEVPHTAIEDAWAVILCIRYFMEKNHALPATIVPTPNVH